MQHLSITNLKIKELLYRSWYRGCKETDILLGEYVRKNHEKFSDSEISLLEELMQESDTDIYNWVSGIAQSPAKYLNLIENITKFNIENGAKKISA